MYSKVNAPWMCRVFGHKIEVRRNAHLPSHRFAITRFCKRCGFVFPGRLVMLGRKHQTKTQEHPLGSRRTNEEGVPEIYVRKVQMPLSFVSSKLQVHYMKRCAKLRMKAMLLDITKADKRKIQQCHRDYVALHKKAMVA